MSLEKGDGGRQLFELKKLLLFWPQASGKIAQKYIFQKLGVKMTRAAFQQARVDLGLAEAQHKEATVKKHAYARLAMAAIASNAGKAMSPQHARSALRKKLKEQFGEDVNTVLLTAWVEESLAELNIRPIPDIMSEAREDLVRLGVVDRDPGRQINLL